MTLLAAALPAAQPSAAGIHRSEVYPSLVTNPAALLPPHCSASTLAEFGTHQLEFWRLSEATGNATYAELAQGSIRHLRTHWPNQVRAVRRGAGRAARLLPGASALVWPARGK